MVLQCAGMHNYALKHHIYVFAQEYCKEEWNDYYVYLHALEAP